MRRILKVILAMLILSMIMFAVVPDCTVGQAGALGYPGTVWSKTGSVTGRVTKSVMSSEGVPGAYVAIVNASNPAQEYAQTASAADGSYSFTGVRATYSSIQNKGPDGETGSRWQGEHMYMIMAKMGSGGEPRYSATFGVDVDNAGATVTSVVLPVEDAPVTPTPSTGATATPTPQASQNANSPSPSSIPQATVNRTSAQQSPMPEASTTQAPASSAVVTPEPPPGPGSTVTPAPAGDNMAQVLSLVAMVIVMVIAVTAVVLFTMRRR